MPIAFVNPNICPIRLQNRTGSVRIRVPSCYATGDPFSFGIINKNITFLEISQQMSDESQFLKKRHILGNRVVAVVPAGSHLEAIAPSLFYLIISVSCCGTSNIRKCAVAA